MPTNSLSPFGNGYPSNGDSSLQPSNLIGNGKHEHAQSGLNQGGRTSPTSSPSIGSSSFLNRPIGNGKTTSNGGYDQPNKNRPSILSGRKPVITDGGKLITDRPSGGGSYDQGGLPSGTHSNGRLQPSRNDHPGGDGRDGYVGRPSYPDQTYTVSQPGSQPGGQSGDVGSHQPQTGLVPATSNLPSTDIYDGIRNAFKLPPGLCIVRCDSLRPGQVSLSTDQIKDAIVSGGSSGEYNRKRNLLKIEKY